MQSSKVVRNVRIFRYDPVKGGEGTFQSYQLTIDNPETTTILDVLLRIQKEQDPSISFRFACRVNMCGSCGMVINGREGLACKTNVCDLPANQDITLRPLNHFPVIKDLLVDMGPFFSKYEDALPFFEPAENAPSRTSSSRTPPNGWTSAWPPTASPVAAVSQAVPWWTAMTAIAAPPRSTGLSPCWPTSAMGSSKPA